MRPATFLELYRLPHPRTGTRCAGCGDTGVPSIAIFFVARIGAFVALLMIGAPIIAALRGAGTQPLGPVAFVTMFIGLIAGFYVAHVLIASVLHVLLSLLRQVQSR